MGWVTLEILERERKLTGDIYKIIETINEFCNTLDCSEKDIRTFELIKREFETKILEWMHNVNME